jgi:UDP-N-acetylmuramyl pentapeptide phosphotransferase/UDP-N-acetylglucosamine-1-phosphate transferase
LILIFFTKKTGFFLDKPKEDRKVHKTATPRIGGLAIFSGISIDYLLLKNPLLFKFIAIPSPLIFIAIVEDLKELSPYLRFVFMFLTAILAIVYLDAVVYNLGFIHLPYPVAILFSIVAIVGAINAFNIVDGLNGLVGGLSILILVAYAYLFHITGRSELAEVSLILAAAVLGFFVLNFPKGLIFLGDTGSYYLGFSIAVLSILLAGAKHTAVSPWVPMVAMFYPVWETLFSIYRRLKEGKNPLHPDKEHLHFLLYRFFNNSHAKATLTILGAQAVLLFLAVLFYKNTPFLIFLFLLAVACYIAAYKTLKRELNLPS